MLLLSSQLQQPLGIPGLFPSDLCVITKKNKLLFTVQWFLVAGKCLEITKIKHAENWPLLVVGQIHQNQQVSVCIFQMEFECLSSEGHGQFSRVVIFTTKMLDFDGTAKLSRNRLCHRTQPKCHFESRCGFMWSLHSVFSKPGAVWLRNLVCLPVILTGLRSTRALGKVRGSVYN